MLQESLLVALPAVLANPPALASDGPDQYPNGSENLMAGALQPPDNDFINHLGYSEGGYRDNNSHKVPGLKVNATFGALRFIRVTNHKSFGGDWAAHAIVPPVCQTLTH